MSGEAQPELPRGPDRRERRAAVLVLLLAGVVLLGALGGRSLENKDITRTAEIARETLHDGRWLAPTREGELETEKPPLYIWLVALAGAATGKIGAFESRLPAALGSLASVLLVFAWTARRRGLATGTAAAGFLATGQLFIEIGRQSRVDALFAFFLALSVVLAYEAERSRIGRKLALGAASGIALGLACLTKTPLAIALHGSVILAVIVVETAFGEAGPRGRARDLVARLLSPALWLPPIVAVLVYGAWWLPFWRSLTEGERADWWKQFRYENTERASDGSDKPRPPWFYVGRLLVQCAPGSLLALALPFLPALLGGKGERTAEDARFERFASVWWTVPFLIFSVAKGKDVRYLLPCLSGLAVAAALGWRALEETASRRSFPLGPFLAWIVFAVSLASTGVAPALAWLLEPDLFARTCIVALAAPAVAVHAFVAARSRDPRAALLSLFLALLLGHLSWNVVLRTSPDYDAHRSPVKTLTHSLPPDVRVSDLVVYQPPRQGERQRRLRLLLPLYLGEDALPRVARDPDELLAQLEPPGRHALIEDTYRADIAPVASGLDFEKDIEVPAEKGEERFLLVKRRR